MYKIKRYFQGVWKQAKMVRWPSRKDLGRYVAVVLGVVCFAAICMVIGDVIVSRLLQTLDQSFPSGGTEEEATALVETIKMIGNSVL